MGKQVVFWSPYAGVSKVTASLCAIAGIFGMQYPELDIAISSVASDIVGPEEYLTERRYAEIFKDGYKRQGMESLKFHFRQAQLSSEVIRRNSIQLKMKTLFLYSGIFAGKEDTITFQLLTQTLRQEYDLVFLDLGNREQIQTQGFLDTADLIVVVLPQSQWYWEDFFTFKNQLLTDKQYCVLIGGYMRKSVFSKKYYYIEQSQGPTCKIAGVIPMNTDFMEAMSEGKILDFLFRNQRARKKEDNYEFIVQTKKAAERIREKLFLY